MTDPETFGERLRRVRHDAGLTQSQLVRRSGITKPTLSRYENDHVMPSLTTLARLARALSVTESILLPGEQTFEEQLIDALHERGIEIRSRAQALRFADLIARTMSEDTNVSAIAGARRSRR